MALSFEAKRALVEEMHEQFRGSVSVVLADYRGLTVEHLTKLRIQARKKGVIIRVARNRMAMRALEGTGLESLESAFRGATLIAFSQQDLGAAAQLLLAFNKEQEQQELQIKALTVEGRLFAPDQAKDIASLPTKEQAIQQLASVLLAPVTKLASALNDIPGRLARTLSAVAESRR